MVMVSVKNILFTIDKNILLVLTSLYILSAIWFIKWNPRKFFNYTKWMKDWMSVLYKEWKLSFILLVRFLSTFRVSFSFYYPVPVYFITTTLISTRRSSLHIKSRTCVRRSCFTQSTLWNLHSRHFACVWLKFMS